MIFVDTHTHLYDEKFDVDRDEVINNAVENGVNYLFLPAVDWDSNEALFEMARAYPEHCFAMIGYHPTSVNDNVDKCEQIIESVEKLLRTPPEGIDFCAVGEIGLDLYWQQDTLEKQIHVLRAQLDLALEFDLPVAIHTRDAWAEMHAVLADYKGRGLRGIMHGFSGDYGDYCKVKNVGDFLFGIGGPITYKKSPQAEVLKQMSIDDLVLETDAPYLTPVPYRGKRNQSSYIPIICEKVALIKGLLMEEVAEKTTANALRMLLTER